MWSDWWWFVTSWPCLSYFLYFAHESSDEVLWWICLCVCLSVCEHISGTTRTIFTNFSVHVACGHGLVLLQQGDEISRGKGSFGGFLSHWQCIVMRSLQRDHSIANNIVQQKGDHSISLPMDHLGRGDGNAQRGWRVIYDCLVFKFIGKWAYQCMNRSDCNLQVE